MQINRNDLIRFKRIHKESGLYKVREISKNCVICYTGQIVPMGRITEINGNRLEHMK